MADPHDALFKAVCDRPEEARGILAAALPPALLQRLDLGTLAPADPNLLDHHLTWRYSDFLYTTSLAGRETFLWILWEHQSTQDALMPLRLLILMGRIWDRWLKQEGRRRKELQDHSAIKSVPAILPVVLYQGPERWTAATELLDVFDLPDEVLGTVREHMPSFRFLIDDLSQTSNEELRERDTGAFGKLVLLLLKHARDEREALIQALHDLRDLIEAASDGDRISAFSYILEVVEITAQELTERLPGDLSEETRGAVMTAADQLRAEGQLRGQRQFLVRLLRRTFKLASLPPEFENRVRTATQAELEIWMDRAVGAGSLDEVFAKPEA